MSSGRTDEFTVVVILTFSKMTLNDQAMFHDISCYYVLFGVVLVDHF
jgi:hypothetical protein